MKPVSLAPNVTLRRSHAVVLLALVIFSWGSTWPVNKLMLHDVTPIWACALRTGIGTLALLLLLRGRLRLRSAVICRSCSVSACCT